MDCRSAREALLEAEPGALAENAEGLLPDHLRRCPSCATAADRVRRATARLAEDLTPGGTVEPRTLAALGVRRRGWRVAALAAAAVVTLLLTRDAPEPPSPAQETLPAGPIRTPAVTVPEGRNAMVFRTADPRITVVWYY